MIILLNSLFTFVIRTTIPYVSQSHKYSCFNLSSAILLDLDKVTFNSKQIYTINSLKMKKFSIIPLLNMLVLKMSN